MSFYSGRLLSHWLMLSKGYVQTITGEGMPIFERPSEHGDLYVEYNVVLPTELSPEMKKRMCSPDALPCL